jgi:hypothetical protein
MKTTPPPFKQPQSFVLPCKYEPPKHINWTQILTIFISVAIPITALIGSNYLTEKREQKNKRREIKIEYLKNSYIRLANSVNRGPDNPQYFRDIELALSEIQLFGDAEVIDSVRAEIIRNYPNDINKGQIIFRAEGV